MPNHRWSKENTCIHCGLTRTKKEAKILLYMRSVLVHGILEDGAVYKYGLQWYYG